jgi:hypothetical protein
MKFGKGLIVYFILISCCLYKQTVVSFDLPMYECHNVYMKYDVVVVFTEAI